MSVRQRRPSASSALVETLKQAERRLENAFVVLWDDLPSWQQDNHFIRSGYRPASGSFFKSFVSISYLHNESVNIWSHLVGSFFFTALGLFLYAEIKPRYSSATWEDILAFGCFFAGASLCLGMSAIYHAISNHSPAIARFGNKLDYIGIILLITGSFVPTVFYGFYCHPYLREAYWIMICSLGLGCATVSSIDRFRTPVWRPYRAAMFVAMGLSGIFPVLHGIKLYGVSETQQRVGLSWLLLQGLLYIVGAALYAVRWPERVAPGSFDIWGSSHQIFHVLVIMAAASHLYGLFVAFDYHHGVLELVC